ncbi:MAG: GxxExxY protein [Nitrospinae bacterium]|nr:GxxExxY protein [Nitrospinota bacterium]
MIAAAIEVHRQLGQGILEAVYQESLAIEFKAKSIPVGARASLEFR